MNLKQLIKEILIEGVFEPTQQGTEQFFSDVKSKINAPLVKVGKGALGGHEHTFLTVCLQKKEDWPNGIFHNSKYFIMLMTPDGTIEVTTSNLTEKSKSPYKAFDRIPVKFRKTKVKDANDLVAKVNKFIGEVNSYYNSNE